MNEPTSPVAIPPLALRPKDAAKALGLSPRKLWDVTADPATGIPHLRMGKVILYPVRELEDWLSARVSGEGSTGAS